MEDGLGRNHSEDWLGSEEKENNQHGKWLWQEKQKEWGMKVNVEKQETKILSFLFPVFQLEGTMCETLNEHSGLDTADRNAKPVRPL